MSNSGWSIRVKRARRNRISAAVPQAAETRQAPDAGEASPRLRLALMAASLAAVMAAVVIYMQIGAPQLVSPPSAEPPQPPQGMQAVLAEIDALAADLMANPDNPQGWAVLGQAYLQLGRFDEAAIAFENAIDRTSGNAALFAALGQAYLFAADGEMVPAAREAFARALDIDPQNVLARFFMAEARFQAGEREAAIVQWQQMLDEAPEGAGYRAMLEARIAQARAARDAD